MSTQLTAWLAKRADWLRSEYLHGGDFEHLKTREDECRYILARAEKLLAPLAGSLEHLAQDDLGVPPQYREVSHGPFEPPESVPLPQSIEDESDEVTL